jgi:hypothetical protein
VEVKARVAPAEDFLHQRKADISRKCYTSEQSIAMLREAEVLPNLGIYLWRWYNDCELVKRVILISQ